MVKAALGCKAGAPEVITSVLQKRTLDPQIRCAMAGLRLWHVILQSHPLKEHVDEVIEAVKGRLGKVALFAFRWGVEITSDGFSVGGRWVPSREEWFIIRKVLLTHFKGEQARRLAARRPHMYEGLVGWNPKQHARLLSSVSPYHAAVLLKLWSSALLCAHKRSQVMGESEMCPCGAPSQAIRHLLWECVFVSPPPMDIEFRKRLKPAQAVAHLLPASADNHEIYLWRKSCLRAAQVLSKPPEGPPHGEVDVDLKGHMLACSEDEEYTFCKKCFISRKSRDRKWIWRKECERKDHEPRAIAETWWFMDHELTLIMETWKLAALRPRMVCKNCGGMWWATSGPKDLCRA